MLGLPTKLVRYSKSFLAKELIPIGSKTVDVGIVFTRCWDQIKMPIPIRGPLSLPFRAFGITQTKMNPNICTICERSFAYV